MRSETECALGVFLPDDGTTDPGNYGNDAPSIPVAGVAILLAAALVGAILFWLGVTS